MTVTMTVTMTKNKIQIRSLNKYLEIKTYILPLTEMFSTFDIKIMTTFTVWKWKRA